MKFPLLVKVGSAVVKIYRGRVKSKGRKYACYTVAYYQNGNGDRKRCVFGNFDDAKKAAHEIATKIAHGRLEVQELTGADRESYINALSLLEPLGVSLERAVEEYVAAHEDEQEPNKGVAELVEELLAAKKRDGLSIRYIQSLRSHLRRFAQSFPTGIASITSRMIEQWLAVLKVGPRARNNIRMSVVSLFEHARRHGYLPKHTRTEAADVPTAKEKGGDIGILSPKELSRLLSKADDEAKLFLTIGGFSGIRTAELVRLEWEDVNFERGHIIVGKHKSKTATRRLVPIQPNLAQFLAPYRGFTGRIFTSEHAADRTIAFAKEHVRWPSNALRHSYATYRLAQTQDAARTALELGNSPSMLFSNYRELADEHDALAWFSIAPEKKPSRKIVQFRS